jgi:DNA-directed RNA polymerase subunit RPC12/RpoP
MTLDFTCLKCSGSFELDAGDLIEGTEDLECPHCEAKATKTQAEDFTSALSELLLQITKLSKKFQVSVEFETEEVAAVAAPDDDEDDDDEDDDDEDDDDEDDDDEDLDDDDEPAENDAD